MNVAAESLQIMVFSASERLPQLTLGALEESAISFQLTRASQYNKASELITDNSVDAVIIDLTAERALELLSNSNRRREWKHAYLSVQLYDLAMLADASPAVESALPFLLKSLMPLGAR